jgi:hypothetical protein
MTQTNDSARRLSTRDLAAAVGMQTDSVLERVRREGDFFGITPMRLPSGRLAWPSDAPARIFARGQE